LSKDADNKEIKKSYRKLALELHPDKLLQQNLTAEEIENKTDHFILVQEAYETLSDDRKRYLYDSTLSGVSAIECSAPASRQNSPIVWVT
jgi:DnaJ-class molecular chaperone